MAPVCPPMRAYWCHLANAIELVLPLTNQSPQPRWQINWSNHFCTAHSVAECRRAHWRHLANTIELVHIGTSWRMWFNMCFLGPTQTTNWSVQPFLHNLWQKVLIRYNGCPFPENFPFPLGDLDPHLIYDSQDQPKPTTQTASRLVQPFLHRWPQTVPILLNRMPLSPSKLPLSMGDLDPCTVLYCILRARVQPTLDPYAEAFL